MDVHLRYKTFLVNYENIKNNIFILYNKINFKNYNWI